MELRIVAYLSKDPTLLAAYKHWDCASCGKNGETGIVLHVCPECGAGEGHRKAESWCEECKDSDLGPLEAKHGFCLGLDIHQITADACKVERVIGKIINFALLYGLGPEGLARHLKINVGPARRIRAAYFEKYSGLDAHNQRIATPITRHGYERTLLGRRRRFPSKHGKRVNLWDREWRQGANAAVQGTAADIMKVAMRNIERRLIAEEEEVETGLILQVHDEVTLETPEEKGDYMNSLVKYEMENAILIGMPFVASGGKGISWAAAK